MTNPSGFETYETDDVGEPWALPQGALPGNDEAVLWRTWAPRAARVALVLGTGAARREVPMSPRPFGYFEHVERHAPDGLRYAYRLDDGPERPDPASRWQPEGVHRPSAVFRAESFAWSDAGWAGVPRDELVIYELHVGTFTPEGTFAAAAERFPALRELGVTAVEIMPVAQFPGGRNWGYDGVHPYAAQNTYGGPRELQRLVDAAHRAGLAVLLDVVYNHLGPEGNYLAEFGPYFTDRYGTPWGPAVNYDGRDCEPVRRFVVDNAVGWVRDFRVDGLRLDAIQTIFDLSPRHVLTDVADAVRAAGARQGRPVHVIGETDQNDVALVTPAAHGGVGLDAIWTDDFHHAQHALLTGETDGYYVDYGGLEPLAKTFRDVFAYDGVWSPFHRRRYGTRVGNAARDRFVACVENHDQIGNRARGDRLAANLSDAAYRLALGLWALHPTVPLLFMGSEYGERRPFPFFCSFEDPQLVEGVRRGRRAEFAEKGFAWEEIPDPQDPATFESARLGWTWPDGSREAGIRTLVADLLRERRTRAGLRDRARTEARIVEVARSGDETRAQVLVVERGPEGAVVAWANPHDGPVALPERERARDVPFLSTCDVRYGGTREPGAPLGELRPFELALFAEEERR